MKKAGMAMVLLTMAVFHVFSADDVVFSEGFDTPEAVAKYGPGDGISFVPEGGAGGSTIVSPCQFEATANAKSASVK